MSFLPNQNFSIITKLTPAEVQVKLDEMLDVQNYQFSGYAADGIFRLQPLGGNRNSFVPQIEGIVEAFDGGSRIQVRIQTAKTVSIIMMAGIAMVFIILILTAVDLLTTKSGHYNFISMLVWLLIFVPMISRFQTESKKVKEILMNNFQGEERPF